MEKSRLADTRISNRKAGAEAADSADLPDTSGAGDDGRKEWWEALSKALAGQGYPDMGEINVLKLRRRFGLESLIDREGMRLALAGKRAPRDLRRRQEILEAIQRVDVKAQGMETAETIRHLLRDAAPYFDIEAVDEQQKADIRLEGKLSKSGILLRCIDDPNDGSKNYTIISNDKLKEHISAAAQMVAASQEADGIAGVAAAESKLNSVHLLTWNAKAAADLKAEAYRRGVRLESTLEFLATLFNCGNAEKEFESRQTTSESQPASEREWLPLKWKMDAAERDEYEELHLSLSSSADEPTTNIVLAQTGAGKSCLVSRVAIEVLKEWRKGNTDQPGRLKKIPIIVRGRDLGSARSLESLALAVAQNLGVQYELSLPQDTIMNLLHRGYLYVMVDSIEETPGFNSLEMLQNFITYLQGPEPLLSNFLITCRTEVFPLEEQEHVKKLKSEGRVHWILIDQIEAGSIEDKSDSLLRLSSATDKNQQLLRPALFPLLNRPLFYSVFAENESRKHITSLMVPTRGTHHAIEQNTNMYELFGRLTRRWAQQVTDGYPASEFPVDVTHFLELCRVLVGIFFEMAVQRGSHLGNHLTFPLQEVLRMLEDAKWQPSPNHERLVGQELLRFLSCSTIFCHKGEKEGAFGELCMPSTSVIAYFLAEYLIEPFFPQTDEALTNARVLVERLSATSLRQLSIPYDEKMSLPEKDRARTEFSTDAKTILLMLISGSLNAKKSQRRIASLFSDISEPSTAILGDQREMIQSLTLSSLMAPLWLSENLLFLKTRSTPLLEVHSPEPIALDGLSCPLSDLKQLLNGWEVEVERDANLEFASLPDNLTPSGSRPQYFHRSPTGLFDDLRDGTPAQEALERALAEWKRTDLLGECRIVLGSRRALGKYDHDTTTSLLREGKYQSPDSFIVQMPTFLIQNTPVSNWNFLLFLRTKNGRKWDPFTVRNETRNDYYLRAWDEVIDVVTWKMMIEGNLRLLTEAFRKEAMRNWLEAPVTYVSWGAAKAYATWLHCRLPTEAEYEAAARAYQGNELEDSSGTDASQIKADEEVFGADLPWVAKLNDSDSGAGPIYKMGPALKGYALSLKNEEQEGFKKDLFPYIRKKLECPGKFQIWEDECLAKLEVKFPKGPLAKALCPVQHLVGGLRYWMEDIWNPCWPPTNNRKTEGTSRWVEAPFQAGWSRTWREEEKSEDQKFRRAKDQIKDWRKLDGSQNPDWTKQPSGAWITGWNRQRVLRGSSLQMSNSQMRISYRESQLETNVNPDVGFRCVRALWNDRSVDYPSMMPMPGSKKADD